MSENERQQPIQKTRILQGTVVTAVRSLRDASSRHDSSRSFAQLEHCVRPGGRRGSQQHQLSCTSQLFPPGALGGPRPLFDMPGSAHGSKHEFSCEKSFCTQDKRLNRQRVCSMPFCTHEPCILRSELVVALIALITPIQKGASRSGGGALASNATVFHAKWHSSCTLRTHSAGQVVHRSE